MDPAAKWKSDLASWAIPREILDAAPQEPWGLPAWLFKAENAGTTETPSRRAALDALPDRGSVLDVGAGGGAASLALVPPAARVTAVDSSQEMLASFAASAERAKVHHAEVLGRWPDVAHRVEPADVLVCHHVLYNVPDIDEFVRALTAAARSRVVVEITMRHPRSGFNPLWKRFHGLDRPEHPTAEDAAAAVRATGVDVAMQEWELPPRGPVAPREDMVAYARRALCLTPDHDGELDALIDDVWLKPSRPVVTMWWPGGATG